MEKRSIKEIKLILEEIQTLSDERLTELRSDERKGVQDLIAKFERQYAKKAVRAAHFEEMQSFERAAKQKGSRIIAVGTTSVRTLESATNDEGILQGISGTTQIFIYPGYKFKMIDALVTNFHLPQSTLLMLISALAGREHCLAAYEEAVKERYRFFSFGDAMFIR